MTTNLPHKADDLLAHAGFVRGLARALVSGDADVDDVVQETWTAALEAPSIRRPRAWLGAVVRRRAARLHRTRARADRKHDAAPPAKPAPATHDLAARHEIIQRVAAALATLPEHERDAVVLRYYDGLPPREVAARLGVPVETARTRVKRGLARLRERLDAATDGDRRAWVGALAPLAGVGLAAGAVVTSGLLARAVAAVVVLGLAGLGTWYVLDGPGRRKGAPGPKPLAVADGERGGPRLEGAPDAQPPRGAAVIRGRVERDPSEGLIEVTLSRLGSIEAVVDRWNSPATDGTLRHRLSPNRQ